MLGVEVAITRFVDDDQPGWVECLLVDAEGKKHLFIEKVPVVTLEDLNPRSSYPRIGIIACQRLARKRVDDLEIVKIDTAKPWAVESIDGQASFVVLSHQLVEF
jgi:hypothetical protein